MNRGTRTTIALVCAVLIAAGTVTPAFAAKTSKASKDETVYVNLDYYGNMQSTIVVNSFRVPPSGTIYDYGAYKNVKNLTNSDSPKIRNRYIEWNASPAAGMFYYQGEIEGAELPWLLSIRYELDGRQVDPASLGGASGRLRISIDARSNKKAHPHFRENFMAQISIALDSQRCRNIEAPDATIVTVGSTRTATFVVMPGASATYTLAADVIDFEMDGISFAATRASSSLTAGIDELQTGLSQMSDGIGLLAGSTGQLRRGADQLSQGIGLLNDAASSIAYVTPSIMAGVADFQNGLSDLNGGANQLVVASAAIREGLGRLDENSYPLENGYSAIEAGLYEMSRQKADIEDGVEQLERNRPLLGGLSSATDQLVAGCAQLEGANAGQIAAIDSLLAAYGGDPALAGALTGVKQYALGIGAGLSQMKTGMGQLGSGVSSLAWGMGELYDTALMFGNGALDLADGASSLHEGIKELNTGFRGYAGGVGEIAENYVEFDAGIAGAQSGISSLSDGFSSIRYGVDGVFSAVGELRDGISSLDQGITTLPDSVQMLEDGQIQISQALGMAGREIAAATGMGQGSTPVSFAAPGIVTPNSVQFVMRTPNIEKPEKPEPEEERDDNLGFLKRLLRLFGID